MVVSLCVATATINSGTAGAVQGSVWLSFDESSAPKGAVVTTTPSSGVSAVRIDVVTRSGGTARRARAIESRWGLRLPAYSGSSDPARAVLRIRGSDGSDPLSPRSDEFQFGADFRLAAISTGSSVDDGDNLLQRGLFDDRAQYKLEVDAGRLGCRVKGASGVVTVRSPVTVSRRAWYRALCRRSGAEVVLKVARITSDGVGGFTTSSVNGVTGDVDMAARVPLSAGGKLSADGSMVLAATDQFNGVVDRVFYRRL